MSWCLNLWEFEFEFDWFNWKSGETCHSVAPGEIQATAGREEENETALVENGGPTGRIGLSHQRESQRQPTQLSGGHCRPGRTVDAYHRSPDAQKASLHRRNHSQAQALHRTQREPWTHIWTEGFHFITIFFFTFVIIIDELSSFQVEYKETSSQIRNKASMIYEKFRVRPLKKEKKI